jgi:hypothetical protein
MVNLIHTIKTCSRMANHKNLFMLDCCVSKRGFPWQARFSQKPALRKFAKITVEMVRKMKRHQTDRLPSLTNTQPSYLTLCHINIICKSPSLAFKETTMTATSVENDRVASLQPPKQKLSPLLPSWVYQRGSNNTWEWVDFNLISNNAAIV